MPRKPCYWTRKLELDLVQYVRQREFIWRPIGNTNHHIQQKYKAYAEFAACLGRGFTARSVRDRWVNIRSTFNHNLRRVEKSRETAKCPADIFMPSWPLWKPLQFLKETSKKADSSCDNFHNLQDDFKEVLSSGIDLKEEQHSEFDNIEIGIRQRGQRTNRPRKNKKVIERSNHRTRCQQVIDELLEAMKPFSTPPTADQTHWFFAKHVVSRLNSMRKMDAQCAGNDILKLLEVYQSNIQPD